MLILSRRKDERIKIGENIEVTVVRISGRTVKLGVDAPEGVLILRDELEPLESPTVKEGRLH